MKQAVGKLQDQIKQNQQHVKQEIEDVKQEVKDVNERLFKVDKDVDEVKVMIIQVLDKLNMLEHYSKVPSPTAGILDTPREDILVAGSTWLSNTSKSTD